MRLCGGTRHKYSQHLFENQRGVNVNPVYRRCVNPSVVSRPSFIVSLGIRNPTIDFALEPKSSQELVDTASASEADLRSRRPEVRPRHGRDRIHTGSTLCRPCVYPAQALRRTLCYEPCYEPCVDPFTMAVSTIRELREGRVLEPGM